MGKRSEVVLAATRRGRSELQIMIGERNEGTLRFLMGLSKIDSEDCDLFDVLPLFGQFIRACSQEFY